MNVIRFVGVIFLVLLCCCLATAQNSTCQAPAIGGMGEANIFPGALERDLGDLFAQRIASDYRFVEDDKVNSYLQKVGERVASKFPQSDLKFQFQVINSGEANALALPGGRVYVTRKLISFLKSEDELAAVLGHEMGHQVTHQAAIDWTSRLRQALGVTSVKDREELEVKLHELLESYRKKKIKTQSERHEGAQQMVADQVAVYAIAAAGYEPHAAVQFWDRFAGTKGNKGGFWSDFFGSTSESSMRLRQFAKTADQLPAGCVKTTSESNKAEFSQWQEYVRNFQGLGRKERIPNLVSKHELKQVLKNDLRYARFSHDGKYVLAQDDAAIYVVSRNPLKTQLVIPAEDAHYAQFTPDDSAVVFSTPGQRVEKWSIAEKQAVSSSDLHVVDGCFGSALSPDGTLFACATPEQSSSLLPMELKIFDLATNETIFEKKSLIGNSYISYLVLLFRMITHGADEQVAIRFSPDGKSLLAAFQPIGDARAAVDVTNRKEMKLKGDLRVVMDGGFDWLGPDRVIGIERGTADGEVVSFPEGKALLKKLPFGALDVKSASRADTVIVGPGQKGGVSVYDLAQSKWLVNTQTEPVDVSDDTVVNDLKNAEVGFFSVRAVMTDPKDVKPISSLELPPAPITNLRARRFSDDGSYVALSNRSRGGVWDARTGERLLYVFGFAGVDYEKDGALLNFLPLDRSKLSRNSYKTDEEWQKAERERDGNVVARCNFPKKNVNAVQLFKRKTGVVQQGSYLLVTTYGKDDPARDSDINIEAYDIHTSKKLWTKLYAKDRPVIQRQDPSDVAIFLWSLGGAGAKAELAMDPAAKAKADAMRDRDTGYLLEVVDMRTGGIKSRLAVDTGKGSWRIESVKLFGDRIIIRDNQERTLVYSTAGEKLHRFFGHPRAVSGDGKFMLLERTESHASLYDLTTFKEIEHYDFPSGIAHAEFSSDGKRVYLVTVDQVVYTFDTSTSLAKVGS